MLYSIQTHTRLISKMRAGSCDAIVSMFGDVAPTIRAAHAHAHSSLAM